MQHMLVSLLVFCIMGLGVTWAAPSQEPVALVKRAVTALGGVQALGQVQSITIKGQAKHWEPEQSVVAGGESRLAGNSTYVVSRDFGRSMARTDWTRQLVYPATREYTFSEIIAQDIGYVQGVDSTARTKQSQEANPPAHTMSGVRVAATLRELHRTSPLLVLDMHNHPKQLRKLPAQNVGGVSVPAVGYQVGAVQFIVMFDPATGLPSRIRTLDYDNIYGDVNFDVALSDWRPVQGVQLAHWLLYTLNDKVVAQLQYNEIMLNPSLAATTFDIPSAVQTTAARATTTSDVPYQWVIRRQFIGVYLDSDKVNFDPTTSTGMRLEELAPGVQHVVGGTHNSLLVEMDKYLIVIDAPINDWQSHWTMDVAKTKYPGKPIKYVVLTHHHMDHAGGTRAYVNAGATVVVGQGNGAHFQTVGLGKAMAKGNARSSKSKPANLVEVATQHALSDGKRTVSLYSVENAHADGMLIGYVEDARLGFVTDIWSPGREKLGEKLTPGQAAVVATVKKYNLQPEKFAGGHGSTGSYAELAAVANK